MKKIIVLLIVLSSQSLAQNLLSNGEFDSDITGWWAFSTISWVDDDGAPLSGNGSLLNEGSSNNNSSFPAISDKFPVNEGFWYMTAVSFKVPSTSSVPRAWYLIYWYDDMEMQIGTSNDVSSVYGVTKDVWHDLAGMSQAPEGAAFGELRTYFQTNEPGTVELPFGLWDDVFVFEETIFAAGFE